MRPPSLRLLACQATFVGRSRLRLAKAEALEMVACQPTFVGRNRLRPAKAEALAKAGAP